MSVVDQGETSSGKFQYEIFEVTRRVVKKGQSDSFYKLKVFQTYEDKEGDVKRDFSIPDWLLEEYLEAFSEVAQIAGSLKQKGSYKAINKAVSATASKKAPFKGKAVAQQEENEEEEAAEEDAVF